MSFNEDIIQACTDLVGRTGASQLEIGFTHADPKLREAKPNVWFASVFYQGIRITVEHYKSPSEAAFAMCERLLRGATCRCGDMVSLSDQQSGCRWQLIGKKWEPGCDVPSLRVKGNPGDYEAISKEMDKVRKFKQ